MSASDHPTQVKNIFLFLSLQNRRRPRGRFTFMAKWSKRLLNMAAALTVAAFMLSGRSYTMTKSPSAIAFLSELK